MRQHGGDRALGEAGDGMAARLDVGAELRHLIDRGDLAAGDRR